MHAIRTEEELFELHIMFGDDSGAATTKDGTMFSLVTDAETARDAFSILLAFLAAAVPLRA